MKDLTIKLDLEIELKDLDVGAEWLRDHVFGEDNKEVENCIKFLYAARTALMEEKIKEAERENAK